MNANVELRGIQNKKRKIPYKLGINVNRHTSCRYKSPEAPKKHFPANHTTNGSGHTGTKYAHCNTNIWAKVNRYANRDACDRGRL